MAAHLDLVQLRRHALPQHFVALADCQDEALTLSSGRPGTAPARFVAIWQVDASRRLICNWALDTDDPHLQPA